MTPLERLFLLEVDYHRQLRTAEVSARMRDAAAAAHTSYAVRHGYEGLLREVRGATARDIEVIKARHGLAGDMRDVLAARDSLKRLLGIPADEM